jgi:hypothetical protein
LRELRRPVGLKEGLTVRAQQPRHFVVARQFDSLERIDPADKDHGIIENDGPWYEGMFRHRSPDYLDAAGIDYSRHDGFQQNIFTGAMFQKGRQTFLSVAAPV